jgi:hypothetical protein
MATSALPPAVDSLALPLPVFAALALIASVSFADTYKPERACVANLEAGRTRVEMWYASGAPDSSMPSQADFDLEMLYDVNKEICGVRYIDRLVIWPQWPERSEVYSEELLQRLTKFAQVQFETALPDFPVFLNYKRPASFDTWISRLTEKTLERPRGRRFICRSWISGGTETVGSAPLRAHYFSCSIEKWKSESLQLVADDHFESEFRRVLTLHLESFARRYKLLKEP